MPNLTRRLATLEQQFPPAPSVMEQVRSESVRTFTLEDFDHLEGFIRRGSPEVGRTAKEIELIERMEAEGNAAALRLTGQSLASLLE